MADNEKTGTNTSLSEVKATAQDLLSRIAEADLTETDLFPHGITHIAVSVKAGDIAVSVEMAGPDKGHSADDEDEEWEEDDLDDLFDDDEDEEQ